MNECMQEQNTSKHTHTHTQGLKAKQDKHLLKTIWTVVRRL